MHKDFDDDLVANIRRLNKVVKGDVPDEQFLTKLMEWNKLAGQIMLSFGIEGDSAQEYETVSIPAGEAKLGDFLLDTYGNDSEITDYVKRDNHVSIVTSLTVFTVRADRQLHIRRIKQGAKHMSLVLTFSDDRVKRIQESNKKMRNELYDPAAELEWRKLAEGVMSEFGYGETIAELDRDEPALREM